MKKNIREKCTVNGVLAIYAIVQQLVHELVEDGEYRGETEQETEYMAKLQTHSCDTSGKFRTAHGATFELMCWVFPCRLAVIDE